MATFQEYCREFVKDNIGKYIGQTYTGSEWSSVLTQQAAANGSLTYDREEAKRTLMSWWEDCAEYYDHEDAFDFMMINPFSMPEAFMVGMVIWGVDSLLSQCGAIRGHRDKPILLTDELATQICNEIENYTAKL